MAVSVERRIPRQIIRDYERGDVDVGGLTCPQLEALLTGNAISADTWEPGPMISALGRLFKPHPHNSRTSS